MVKKYEKILRVYQNKNVECDEKTGLFIFVSKMKSFLPF